jgi:hypothetical protein
METVNYWINVIKAFSKALDCFKTEFEQLKKHDTTGTIAPTEDTVVVSEPSA